MTVVYDLFFCTVLLQRGESLQVDFWRYSATGNTFLMFDSRAERIVERLSADRLNELSREYDVDGVIFLESSDEHDFHMRYLNADGYEVEMCGNGTRAITHFASQIVKVPSENSQYSFTTFAGIYQSRVDENFPVLMTEMKEDNAIDVSGLYSEALSSYYINTGVPHVIYEVEDPQQVKLEEVAPPIRYHQMFNKGTNVNFYCRNGHDVMMRTYERGVEGETASCGTGAVAVVLSLVHTKGLKGLFKVKMPGGELMISYEDENVWLAGKVEITEQGSLTF